MKLSIIIPNYNTTHLLEKNLPSVIAAVDYYKKNVHEEGEILIIDDQSTDSFLEKKEALEKKYLAHCIRRTKNEGFSSTINDGVSRAKGEIVMLLNSDVLPEKEFLLPLMAHFTSEKIFAVGCMDKSIENDHVVLRGRGVGTWKRGFLIHARGEVNKKSTLWVNGGSGAFRRSLWEKLGGMDTLYNPFYWEDIDLSYRALKSGYKILFEKESIVTHEHEKGVIKASFSPFTVKKIAYRNQFIFVWKNATDTSLLVSHILWLPYHCFFALLRFDGVFFLSMLLALVQLPQIITRRSKAQRHFSLSDKAVTNEFVSQ